MDPIFDLGDLIRVTGTFLNSNGSAIVDPVNVYFQYNLAATGVTNSYTYGSGSFITREAAGIYHADLDTNESSGKWYWRMYSTSTGQAAEEGSFYVRPRQF